MSIYLFVNHFIDWNLRRQLGTDFRRLIDFRYQFTNASFGGISIEYNVPNFSECRHGYNGEGNISMKCGALSFRLLYFLYFNFRYRKKGEKNKIWKFSLTQIVAGSINATHKPQKIQTKWHFAKDNHVDRCDCTKTKFWIEVPLRMHCAFILLTALRSMTVWEQKQNIIFLEEKHDIKFLFGKIILG